MSSLRSDTLTMRVTGVRISVLWRYRHRCHCSLSYRRGPFLSQTAENNCPYHRVVGFLILSGQFIITVEMAGVWPASAATTLIFWFFKSTSERPLALPTLIRRWEWLRALAVVWAAQRAARAGLGKAVGHRNKWTLRWTESQRSHHAGGGPSEG